MKPKTNKPSKVGLVTSVKMQKTAVVKVEIITVHPKYKKTIKRFKKFKAHNQLEDIKVGDKVKIVSTRPISKEKSWVITEKVK
jgi:small subunit ribosomal protein S17